MKQKISKITTAELPTSAPTCHNTMLCAVRSRTIEHFPKNKEITNGLSNEQILIRQNVLKVEQKEFQCKKCGFVMPINEFYIKDKNTGRRATSCRDCQMKINGILEIGKVRFSKKIFKKGFRRCSCCKDILPLDSFHKNNTQYCGKSNVCYPCAKKRHDSYMENQKNEIGDAYVKIYGKRNGVEEFSTEKINELRLEIIESRKNKYFIDGCEFLTIRDFAKYIEKTYGLPITTTEKRVGEGKNLEDCKLSESEMRSKGRTIGKILVEDVVTGIIFEFKNSRDENLKKMFSGQVVTNAIKSGEKTNVTFSSKYKNPCLISRV